MYVALPPSKNTVSSHGSAHCSKRGLSADATPSDTPFKTSTVPFKQTNIRPENNSTVRVYK